MSIQDESFPIDEFLDELDFKQLTGMRFQFPHHHREQRHHQSQHESKSNSVSTIATTNTSSSSGSTDQNLSTESHSGRPMSGMSSKTTASDPDDNGSKKSDFTADRHNKAVSYQDIHSEYTKRRFKHVESKVGQYIANMRAEDEKRRQAKFQRHRSMPETLSGSGAIAADNNKRTTMRYSAGELHCMNESNSDGETDYSKNTTATTSASSSSGTAPTATTNNSAGHETSDDASANGVDFIDKQTYAQILDEKDRIQSYSEYLQTKLDDKVGENMRLKRNVEFMRIELTNAKDKLKQKQVALAPPLGGGGCLVGRLPLQALLYCQAKSSKATQTDLKTPPLTTRDLYITPDTPSANTNNMFESVVGKPGKTVATIQPLSLNFSNIAEQDSSEESVGVLRQRTNSNPSSGQLMPNMKNNNSRISCPSSSDSAIYIESAELGSPKLLHKHQRAQSTQSLRRGEYYDKQSGRYATLQTLNSGAAVYDENDEVVRPEPADRVKTKKHLSLRRRWLRIFGPCTRCNEPNRTLDSSALQQTYTQIPLLEKSYENHCRNIR